MSGIEIAGLVLAVMPLFIAAAEHLQRNTKSKKAIRTAGFACSYKVKLTQQQALLSLYIKGVVGRTSLPIRKQAELVDEPAGEAWTHPEVKAALAQELGEAYEPFVDLLSRVCAALALCVEADAQAKGTEQDTIELLKSLSLDSRQTPKSRGDYTGVFKRIKLNFKSSDGKAVLAEIEKCNEMLERLSKAAFQAKTYENTQQARRAHTTFRQREDAERLFHVLWKACKCQNAASGRDVALRLQVPSLDADSALESRFQMLLFDSQQALCQLSARITRSVEQAPARKKTRISFERSKSDPTSQLQSDSMKILGEICDEIKVAAANHAGLEIYVDGKEDVYTQQEKPTISLPRPPLELLSLASMMSRLQLYEGKKWVHREKSILAVTLAYSLLRLHESPWLQNQWNTNSISFVNEQSGHVTERFKLRQPFTRSQVSSAHSGCQTAFPSPTRRNAHLHALGIILLELYLNRSLESDFQEKIQKFGSADYRGVAIDVLEERSDDMNMTAEYNRAICFCLSPYPSPKSGKFSFEDQGFREIFYNEVIVNLEENLRARFEVGDDFFI